MTDNLPVHSIPGGGGGVVGGMSHWGLYIIRVKKIFFATRLVTRVSRYGYRRLWGGGGGIRRTGQRYPGAHAPCGVQRAVSIVASSSFRVLFRKWFTRMMYRPHCDMPPPPPDSIPVLHGGHRRTFVTIIMAEISWRLIPFAFNMFKIILQFRGLIWNAIISACAQLQAVTGNWFFYYLQGRPTSLVRSVFRPPVAFLPNLVPLAPWTCP